MDKFMHFCMNLKPLPDTWHVAGLWINTCKPLGFGPKCLCARSFGCAPDSRSEDLSQFWVCPTRWEGSLGRSSPSCLLSTSSSHLHSPKHSRLAPSDRSSLIRGTQEAWKHSDSILIPQKKHGWVNKHPRWVSLYAETLIISLSSYTSKNNISILHFIISAEWTDRKFFWLTFCVITCEISHACQWLFKWGVSMCSLK